MIVIKSVMSTSTIYSIGVDTQICKGGWGWGWGS